MAQWFSGITRDLNWLEADLFMTTDHEYLHHDLDLDQVKTHFEVDGVDPVHFAVSFRNWHWFTLKEKVEALEAKVEGLGETAIHWLDTHIQPLCTAVTPNFCLYAAQYSYWYGEDDESLYVEECLGEGEDPEDVDVYRRAQFDASFPKMAYEAGEKLDKNALQGLLSHPDGEVAALAAMLLEPEVEAVDGSYLQQFADEHLPLSTPAICLAWSEGDDSVLIADDYMHLDNEGGNGTEYHSMWTVENTPAGFLKAKEAIETYVSRLKKIEDVLSIVATLNDNI